MLIGNYTDLFDIIMDGMDEKKVQYAAATIEDASRGCPESEIVIELPYDVNISCFPTAKITVGKYSKELSGITCTGGRQGRRLKISRCTLEII